ncbi:hypothetical protein EGW08_020369 [Elysia chlorotica]|uniref:Uncharacterized protein n=1 Tax=Elysia chlorotica TaxID=188477 RepID=A0A3S1BPS5_ELYCH|nr:hypothetical protein EGW08_020369 [Elysia chlorotica]
MSQSQPKAYVLVLLLVFCGIPKFTKELEQLAGKWNKFVDDNGCLGATIECSALYKYPGDVASHEEKCSFQEDIGACTVKKCSTLQEKYESAKQFSDLFIELTKQSFQCDIKAENLLGSGSMGVLQPPVWGSLAVLLVAAVVARLLV